MKRINLDQIKNMSIDNLIESYRSGYRLEEHTPITSLSNLPNFSNIHTLQGPLLDPVVNFGKVTVSIGYDAVATSIILNTNEGSKLPDPSSGAFNLVWWNSTDYPDPSDDPNKEIVRCTTKITDTLTVTRPQEGTSASVKNLVGKTYKMILSPTAKTISDISGAIIARVAKTGDTMSGTLTINATGGSYGLVASSIGDATIVASGSLRESLRVDQQGTLTANNTYNIVDIKRNAILGGFTSSGAVLALDDTVPSTGNILAITGGGFSETIKIDNTGNLTFAGSQKIIGGIGATSDLTLQTTSGVGLAGADMHFLVGNNGATEAMTILNSGFIGIGTIEPSSKLEVVGGNIRITENSEFQLMLRVSASGNQWWFGTDTSGKLRIKGNSDQDKFTIQQNGNVGIGTTTPTSLLDVSGTVQLRGIIGGTGLTVDAGGKVGIGTTTPLSKLHIANDSINDTLRILHTNTTAGITIGYSTIKTLATNASLNIGTFGTGALTLNASAGTIDLTAVSSTFTGTNANTRKTITNTNTVSTIIASEGTYGSVGTSTNHAFTIKTNNTDKVTVLSSGNVGIGTTTPSEALDVVGNIKVSGTVDGVDISTVPLLTSISYNNQSFINIVKNGNFESWSNGTTSAPDGFINSGLGGIAREAVIVKNSSYSAKLIAGSNNYPGLEYDLNFSTYKNVPLTVGMWVYVPTTNTLNNTLITIFYDNGNWVSTLFSCPKNDTWTYYQQNINTSNYPSWNGAYSTAKLHISPRYTNTTEADVMYIDSLIIVEGSVCPIFSEKPLVDDGKTLYISSTNNMVGISTTVPTSTLDVNGTAQLRGIVGGTGLTVDAGGKVGIGTTSPTQKLSVVESTIEATYATNPTAAIFGTGNAGLVARNTDLHSETQVISSSYGIVGTSTNHDLSIRANNVDHVRLTSDGNVGIGTTSPGEKLTIGDGGNIFLEGGMAITSYGGFGRYQNLFKYSGEFDNSVWDKETAVTVTANATTAPDGTQTADKLAYGASGNLYLYQSDLLTGSAGFLQNRTFTISIWTKRDSGTASLTLQIRGAGGTPVYLNKSVTVTTSWQRFTHTATFSATDNNTQLWGLYRGNLNEIYYVWGAQMEEESSTGQYVLTKATTITSTGHGLIAQSDGPHLFLNGNVGIGTTNPTSLLDVNGTVQLRGIIGGTGLTVDAGGKVGIGTASPAHLFEIRKDQNSITRASVTNGTTGTAAVASFIVTRDGGEAIELRTFSTGYTTSGLNIANSAGLRTYSAITGGLTLITGSSAPIIFGISDIEKMRIDGSGNVGIGTTTPTSKLQTSGSFSAQAITISGSVTLDETYYTVLCNAGTALTVTLPDASTCPGRIYNIKKKDSSTNVVTIATTGGQTIDGAASRSINIQYETVSTQSDGIQWWVV